jgi:hypothetical protein
MADVQIKEGNHSFDCGHCLQKTGFSSWDVRRLEKYDGPSTNDFCRRDLEEESEISIFYYIVAHSVWFHSSRYFKAQELHCELLTF